MQALSQLSYTPGPKEARIIGMVSLLVKFNLAQNNKARMKVRDHSVSMACNSRTMRVILSC